MKKALCLLVAILSLTACFAMATGEENTGIWELKAYTDEFDLPTDEFFIVSDTITGHFSNSATTNSELSVYVFYQEFMNDGVIILSPSIRMFEYGTYRVQNSSSKTKYYDVVMMGSDGVKYNLTGVLSSNSYDIAFWDITDGNPEALVSALKNGGTVRFAVTERDDPLTKYVFTIDDASGFDAAFTKFKAI